jgi:hypothetical protein
MWAVGALNVFGGSPFLSVGILITGGIAAVAAGFLLLASRPSGRLDHRWEDVTWFCVTLGIGVASLGLAISPLTHWLLPGLIFAAGGIALIAWAPQAFGRSPRGF